MLQSGLVLNYTTVAKLAFLCLTQCVIFSLQAVQRKVKWMNGERREKLWESTHKRNAKRLLKAIIELEGLWVKLGQYLSTRADVLPEAYIDHLKQLQDSLPPRPLHEVNTLKCCLHHDSFLSTSKLKTGVFFWLQGTRHY